ncbi:dipeptidyl peptidase IV N-terminal region-domain-containing protein [Tuber brumale]|nr:dipeptidyl peptidase IV N-terminal region-domain-containing protein [Tuber brumale]
MRFSTPLLFSLLSLSPISHAAPTPQAEDEGDFTFSNTKKLATFADAFSQNFSVSRTTLLWISAGGSEDGTYVAKNRATSSLELRNIVTNASSILVDAAELKLDYDDYSIQPSAKHVLFSANYTKQYRHSYFADYYVWSVEAETLVPLVEGQSGDVQYAVWSPHGNVIAYVRGNDLFVWRDGVSTRVTNDGGENVFNGVPDWVYEEEIFGDRYTLWFSPDGEYLAFLRFDETGVPTYTVPYYMAGQRIAPPYPKDLHIRYPKVGEKNPTVTFHLLEVSNPSVSRKIDFQTYDPDNLVITEVAWVAEKHESVIFRTQGRTQDTEKLVLVDVGSGNARVVRERNAADGWLDNFGAIAYVPGLSTPSYVDISDHSGWPHIYLYPVAGGEPIALTSGDWAVTRVCFIDTKRRIVYYQSTERDSTERHIFSVSLDGEARKPLVDITKDGYYSASFSSGGGYYILGYNGPNLPWQELRSISSGTPIRVINDNASLKNKLSEYALPKISWSTLKHPDGYELNFVERLPPKFRKGEKYPVLFDIYGGPGSQYTAKTFRQTVDFSTYLGSDPELGYIVVSVDNLRTQVAGRLGKLEAEDQVWAAREYAKRDYVNAEKIAIWGWSYGGYLTGKVLELDSGAFSLGIMTAPVTDWRFYDSIYTERYMKLLTTNGAGYNASAITKTAGFKNVAGGFLIQHGTGDDNVHFQNSAALADALVYEGVSPEKMRVQWFTDSDHGIDFHRAGRFLYKQLAKALYDEKRRTPEGKHQWSRRRVERGR